MSALSPSVFQDSLIAIGGEDGCIAFHSLEPEKKLGQVEAHSSRVKALHSIYDEQGDASRHDALLFSAHSDGVVKLWLINIKKERVKASLLGSTDITCRPTCMTVFIPQEAKNVTNLIDYFKKSIST